MDVLEDVLEDVEYVLEYGRTIVPCTSTTYLVRSVPVDDLFLNTLPSISVVRGNSVPRGVFHRAPAPH